MLEEVEDCAEAMAVAISESSMDAAAGLTKPVAWLPSPSCRYRRPLLKPQFLLLQRT